jgi:chemosensory pili system protein ChpA (sensor histidine kinase/response regulator)
MLRSIFEPGTTSRSEADTLAGRGVGLDSVRETLARLGGEIRVTSTIGKGTTFSMRLPLTTALNQALLFKLGGNVYAVPNVHVVETAYIEADEIEHPSDLVVRGQNVPLLNLHRVLGTSIDDEVRSIPVVIMAYASKRLAVTTDKIVGPREIVVKSLGNLLAPIPLYAGGTISGSGKVQLILDPAALARLAHPEELAQVRAHAYGLDADRERPQRVLVVDDSRAIREALIRILERSGYVVDVADQGARAWNMLHQVSYDALVTDIEMPVMDGFDLIGRVRNEPELRRMKVVVISSRTDDTYRNRADEFDVHAYLSKPVTAQALVSALKRER